MLSESLLVRTFDTAGDLLDVIVIQAGLTTVAELGWSGMITCVGRLTAAPAHVPSAGSVLRGKLAHLTLSGPGGEVLARLSFPADRPFEHVFTGTAEPEGLLLRALRLELGSSLGGGS